jgi:hypothetical protein
MLPPYVIHHVTRQSHIILQQKEKGEKMPHLVVGGLSIKALLDRLSFHVLHQVLVHCTFTMPVRNLSP